MPDQTNSLSGGTQTGGSTAGTSVRDEATALGGKAVDRIAGAADEHKSTVAQPLRQVSDAIEAAGAKLTEGNASTPAWVSDSLKSVATQVSDFAQKIETSDSKQLLSDVQDFARTKPVLFLAGCAALGFAAARVLRAGSAPSTSSTSDSDWHEGDVGGFGTTSGSTYGGSAMGGSAMGSSSTGSSMSGGYAGTTSAPLTDAASGIDDDSSAGGMTSPGGYTDRSSTLASDAMGAGSGL